MKFILFLAVLAGLAGLGSFLFGEIVTSPNQQQYVANLQHSNNDLQAARDATKLLELERYICWGAGGLGLLLGLVASSKKRGMLPLLIVLISAAAVGLSFLLQGSALPPS